ncbi:predicted protein [Naegleria gruberi]|uniref:Predicted protein n=1 Tax=Naegleria gruberi TaxID=5762 RepID=D2UZ51_NAEGR|nr:uncharacterized protein NAEGRDRAFT_61814 [Naegleria gruberi]EFC49883.1 predicted protein [Naegleria gruberi]|eukprot:XP_002682627.1 predicted protein [Naegleria gruberi strain NEG-M]
MAITTTEKVKVWGSNNNGMLTLGDEYMIRYPRKLTTFGLSYSNVSVVIAKSGNACSFLLTALGNDSSTNVLEYWGGCNNGLGFSVTANTPTQALTSLTSKKVIDLDMKGEFAVALVENGDVYAWGKGDYYSFGSSSSSNPTPTLIYSNVKLITAASSNTYLLLQNGTLLGIGDNTYDELGVTGPTSISNFIALNTSIIDSNNEVIVDIKGGTQTLFVLTDKGNVYGIGLNTGGNKYLSPSATSKYSTFIRINGNVKVRKMFVGFYSATVFVSTSGVPYYFDGTPIKLNLPSDDSYLVDSFMYSKRHYFITKKGNVYTSGSNDYYQTSYRSGFNPVISAPTLYMTKDYFDGVPYMGIAGSLVAGIITREEYTCFGVNSTDSTVCSSRGYCSGPDSCTCDEGYYGLTCANFSCNSISSFNSSVCSGRGICSGPNTCSNCTNSIGNNCEYPICYGTYSNNVSVCSGNGYCTSVDTCQCKFGFYGTKCEYRTCFGGSALNGVLPRQTVADVFCKNINKLLK